MVYRFADLELDESRQQLSRAGEPIALPGTSYKLLLALVKAAPRVLDQDALTDQVHLVTLREAVGDDPARPKYFEELEGEGVRLVPTVSIGPVAAKAAAPAEASPRRTLLGIILAVVVVLIGTMAWLFISRGM